MPNTTGQVEARDPSQSSVVAAANTKARRTRLSRFGIGMPGGRSIEPGCDTRLFEPTIMSTASNGAIIRAGRAGVIEYGAEVGAVTIRRFIGTYWPRIAAVFIVL